MNYDFIASDVEKNLSPDARRNEFKNPYCKIKVRAQYLGTNEKEQARKKYISIIENYKSAIQLSVDILKQLSIWCPDFNCSANFQLGIPIQIKFSLDKPYVSRDDDDFYIIDNPIRKDKVFKVPMISPASWKGNLRWVAMKLFEFGQLDGDKALNRLRIVKLFGNENETDKKFMNSLMGEDEKANYEHEIKKITKNEGQLAGRLLFYPTFFDQIGLEVINPHSRKTRAGTNPIYFETVPAGASGTFSLLYHPFSLIGKDDGTEEIKKKIKDELTKDILFLCHTLKETMLTYGFSAKKSSGFGIAHPDIELIQSVAKNDEAKNENTIENFELTLDRSEIPKKCIQFLIDDEFPILDKKQQKEKVERGEWKSIRPYKNAKREYMDILNQKKEQLQKEKMKADFKQPQISSSGDRPADKFAELEEMLLSKIETVIE